MKKKKRITNAEFTKNDLFRTRCLVAKIQPTKRQASKYRRNMGLAAKITPAQVKSFEKEQA